MPSTGARRALIARLETQAQETPDRYRKHVLALALLGLVVMALGVSVSLGVSIGLVVVLAAIKPVLLLQLAKLIWIPIGAGWMLLRALWVKFDVPAGRLLRAGEAPALVAEVERLRAPSGAPALDGIVIDDDMNAAAATVPRAMGLLGGRHYLVLGLPLMQALEPEEFAAVVAHEFGHFSGRHGRMHGWIYHARISWYRVLEALQQRQSWLLKPFMRFFDWYVPYFEAYSFVLARRQEYEADLMAARLVGAAPLASALSRIELGAQRLAVDFWPGIDRSVAMQPEPPLNVQQAIASMLRSEDPMANERLDTALSRAPGLEDTHPTLAHRTRALGIEAALPVAARSTAADSLLGGLLPELQAHFSDQWRTGVAEYWARRHSEGRSEADRLAVLNGKAAVSPDEAAEAALLTWSHERGEVAERLLHEAAARCPSNAMVQMRLGEAMLARGADGASHLWRALELDPTLGQPVLELLGPHYSDRSDNAGSDRVDAAWVAERARQQRSQRARSTALAGDALEPHGLTPAQVEAAKAAFRAHGNIKKAWLVRKTLPPELGAASHHLVLVTWRGMMFSQQNALDRLLAGLDLPGSYMAMTLEGHRNVARRIRKVAGDPVYRHGKP
jgi:Zn-dependent protease with chaperone function